MYCEKKEIKKSGVFLFILDLEYEKYDIYRTNVYNLDFYQFHT